MAEIKHGLHWTYSDGLCRCDECREAKRVYVAARRRASLAAGTLTHGKRGTYDAGCRCHECTAARKAAYPRERQLEREKRGGS